MKRRHFVALGIVVLVLGTYLAGCSLLGTSMDVRIGDFVINLNGDRTQVYLNLVPDSTPYTLTQGQTGLWDTWFPTSDGTYTSIITSTEPLSSSGVLVDITPSGTGIAGKWKFVLTDTGSIFEEYYISDILVWNGSAYVSIF